MPDTHEPREPFVERLGEQIRAEFRRRPSPVRSPRWTQWLLQSPLKAAAAVAVLVLVSMGLGGIVVAAAYQAQSNEQRAVLMANFQQRAELARQRIAMARDQLKTAQERVSVGIEGQDVVLEARFKLQEAEIELRVIESQLAEIRVTGREPVTAVSSPLVSGRDFVLERWQIEMSVPAAALDLEKARLKETERRIAAGVASPTDSHASRTRIIELESAVEGIRRKIDIRQRFLNKELDATLADLRVLEAEAEQRRRSTAPRIELAKRILKDVTAKFQQGIAQSVEVAEAEMRVRQLELESLKAALDLALIQQQIAQRLVGK